MGTPCSCVRAQEIIKHDDAMVEIVQYLSFSIFFALSSENMNRETLFIKKLLKEMRVLTIHRKHPIRGNQSPACRLGGLSAAGTDTNSKRTRAERRVGKEKVRSDAAPTRS